MSFISLDCEADGPYPPHYSMVSFGAVEVGNQANVFYSTIRPISELWVPQALAVSGFSREDTMLFPEAREVITLFVAWVNEIKNRTGRAMLLTDNPYFDSAFINYYTHTYTGSNPFGFSSTSLTSLYKGFVKTNKASFKHLRKTQHTHNALSDALGNAEAFEKIIEMGYKI